MRVQDFLDRLVRTKLWYWLLGRPSPQISARSDWEAGKAPRHGPTRTPRTPPKVDPKYACEPFRGAAIGEDHEGAGLDHQYARSARESGSHGAGDDAQIVSPSDPRTARGGSGGGDAGRGSRRRRAGWGRKGSRGTWTASPALESNRTCRNCGETKPLDYQHYNQIPNGGFRWSCKRCRAANTGEYDRRNPEKAQERAKRYKERKAAAGGSYTAADIRKIRTQLGDRCGYCGDPLRNGGEVEHMLPVSRGGTSNPDNLTLACRTCNGDKGRKTVEGFIAYLRKHGRPVRSDIWGGATKP
jgi:hypothetical protein